MVLIPPLEMRKLRHRVKDSPVILLGRAELGLKSTALLESVFLSEGLSWARHCSYPQKPLPHLQEACGLTLQGP